MSAPLKDPSHRESAFLLYATFAGDATRTAAALNLRESDVTKAAQEGEWDKKLASIIALRRSAAPGDIERSINRALAFVQGHRLRMQLDRVLMRLELMTEEELDEYLLPTEVSKSGNVTNKFSTRAFTDLAAAVEKANAVCSIALSDTAQDRSRREESEQGGESSGQIHAAIAKAMAEVGENNSPTAMLLEAQIAVGESVVASD